MTCELCNLEKRTKWYYEDKYFVVCECETCKTPMIVLRRHDTKLNQEEMIDLMWIIKTQFNVFHQVVRGELDQNRRKVPDHWHAHIR